MFIKKYKNNEYINASGVWVRNLTKPNVKPVDINSLIRKEDYSLVLNNEILNNNSKIYNLEKEECNFSKVLIISNGYKFKENLEFLENLPNDISIFAVNRTLHFWDIKRFKKPINFYIVNNPDVEALSFISNKIKYFPSCLASTRTNHIFCKRYNGMIYRYYPVNQENFGNSNDRSWYLDDYRSPICAAISAAYSFNARKILLFHCEELMENERPYSLEFENRGNKFYMYPQQKLLHDIIDANLFWIANSNEEIKIGYSGYGLEYVNAAYIEQRDIKNFFEDKDE